MKTLKWLNASYGRYFAIVAWSFCLVSWGMTSIKTPSWHGLGIVLLSFIMLLLPLWSIIIEGKTNVKKS